MAEEIWHTMVVRAWRDRDGLKIRFMAEDANRFSTSVAVEATVESATHRFVEWLLSVDSASTRAAGGGSSGGEQRGATHGEDAGTTSEKTAGP